MKTINEMISSVLNREAVTVDEIVTVTDALLNALDLRDRMMVEAVYSSLATKEDAIIVPAVYSIIGKGQAVQPYHIFTRYIEIALQKLKAAMYTQTVLADGSIVRQATGEEATIMVSNLVASHFPTVDLGYLAKAIQEYNVDYKRAELQDILNNSYCLVNVLENETNYLAYLG